MAIGVLVFVGVVGINASPLLPAPHEDPASVLGAAEALIDGRGLRVPFGHWSSPDSTQALSPFPPGPSLLVAAPMGLGFPAQGASLLVLALSAGLTVALVYWIGNGLTGPLIGLLPVLLVMASEPLVRIHTAIWREPPFLALLAAFVWAVVRWPRRALPHGGLATVMVMVCYVGLATVLAAVIWAWRTERRPDRRLAAMLRAGLPGVALFGGWSLLVALRGEAVREPKLRADALRGLTDFAWEFRSWLIPGIEGWVAVGLAIFVALAGAWVMVRCWRHAQDRQVRRFLDASALFEASMTAA